MKKILVVDNYDSFTFNLVQYLGEMDYHCDVFRHDTIFFSDLLLGKIAYKNDYCALVISPGPCSPDEAGLSCKMIEWAAGKMPILGVCLGHQCIAKVYGGEIVRAKRILHGKISAINHDAKGVFLNMKNPLKVARYHSLVVKKDNLPDCFEMTAWDEVGEIMAFRHKSLPIVGLQFHPESFATEYGHDLLKNFFISYPIS